MGICLWLLYPNMSSELECSMWDFIFFIKLFGQSVSQSWCRIPNLLNCLIFHVALYFIPKIKMMAKGDIFETHGITTRNSAIADKPRDAFRGQSRSPNMVLWRKYVRYGFLVVCFGNFVPFSDIRLQKRRDLEIRVRGNSRSLKVVPIDRLDMVSY